MLFPQMEKLQLQIAIAISVASGKWKIIRNDSCNYSNLLSIIIITIIIIKGDDFEEEIIIVYPGDANNANVCKKNYLD